MSRTRVLRLVAALTAAGFSFAAHSADGAATANADQPPKKMKMDAPMSTGMAKKGMMKGDVKSSADKKLKAMQPMMAQEQQSMPPASDRE